MPSDFEHPENGEQLQAVLFDLDGTLLDTARDLARALNRLLVREGRTPLPFEAIRAVVSNGGNAMVSLGFGLPREDPAHHPLYQALLALYGQDLASDTRPFEGIEALLGYIGQRGLSWGVVTNKPRPYSEPLLAAMNLAPPCGVLVCPDDVSQRKPHPEPMYLACRLLDCEPARTLYVGDHRRDIEAGKNAGMTTVAAHYGYIDSQEDISSWQADYVIRQPVDLIGLLDDFH